MAQNGYIQTLCLSAYDARENYVLGHIELTHASV